MGTLHLAVSVFALIWKTPRLLKLKKIISLSRGRTLSGHTWSTAAKFSILNLSSLHPYGKPYLGYAARRRFTLLGDGSQLLGQAQDDVAQRIQGARGLAVGGTPTDTHDRLHGLRSQGWSSPQDEALRSTARPARHREDIMKIRRNLLGYVTIP